MEEEIQVWQALDCGTLFSAFKRIFGESVMALGEHGK